MPPRPPPSSVPTGPGGPAAAAGGTISTWPTTTCGVDSGRRPVASASTRARHSSEIQVAREREPRHAAAGERADERLEIQRAAAEGPAVDHDLVVQPEERERVLAALVARRHHALPELRERRGSPRGARPDRARWS